MSLRAKIASVILFILVAVSCHFRGFVLSNHTAVGYLLLLSISSGMLLIIVTDVNVWLKLFLFGAMSSVFYAHSPGQAGVCLAGIIFCVWVYYYLTRFEKSEIESLLSFIGIIVGIQAMWVMIVYFRFRAGKCAYIDIIGTIGYRNLVALLLASTLPLVIVYRKKLTVPVLIAWWFCHSLTSIGTLVVSMGVFLFEKSRRYAIIMLISIGLLGYVGVNKLLDDRAGNGGRLMTWKKTVYIIKKHPLMGCGLGSGISSKLKNVQTRYAHNDFLDLAKEAGLITVIPIIFFVGNTFVWFLRSDKTKLQRVAFGTLFGFYVGMFFSFPIRNIGMSSIMIVVLAANCVVFKKVKR